MVLSIITFSCNNSTKTPVEGKINFDVRFLAFNCAVNPSDRGDILFITKVENHTDKVFTIDNPDTVSNSLEPKIVMISNKIINGVIGLHMSVGAKGKIIDPNNSALVSFNLDFDGLKARLITPYGKETTMADVKNFLNSANYSLLLVMPQNSACYFISKSKFIKSNCSLDSLKIIFSRGY